MIFIVSLEKNNFASLVYFISANGITFAVEFIRRFIFKSKTTNNKRIPIYFFTKT
jgi:hypothetical protein